MDLGLGKYHLFGRPQASSPLIAGEMFLGSSRQISLHLPSSSFFLSSFLYGLQECM